ncbi:site-specific integrase [Dapis sp. BLCC M229]|uniref:site-specific integrase n=1 Tax=Dapis sp. BLCC M229 TaxID=3400188 RepID=UPI003CE93957
MDKYLCDFDAFTEWFKSKNQEQLTPAVITATDLREYKRYLDETLELKPQTINRKLSSLRSFLNDFRISSLLLQQEVLITDN